MQRRQPRSKSEPPKDRRPKKDDKGGYRRKRPTTPSMMEVPLPQVVADLGELAAHERENRQELVDYATLWLSHSYGFLHSLAAGDTQSWVEDPVFFAPPDLGGGEPDGGVE